MSLINEALKKAQRQRTTAADGDASAPGDRTVQKRAAPMRAQTMIIVAAAAIALVVCSVVATVYLLTRKPSEAAKSVANAPGKAASVDLNAPSPVIVPPVVPAPTATTASIVAEPSAPPVRAKAAPVASSNAATSPTTKAILTSTVASAPAPSAPSVAAVTAAPAASVTPAAPAPRPSANLPPDPRILQFVDAIKVTGIRSSGTDSKVLMNDRVFRVNEIVERALEVKLVKVASDSLTFEDANGVIYTKTF